MKDTDGVASDSETKRRIAVIAIHGVGEHAPGETVACVARTLLASRTGRYVEERATSLDLAPPAARAPEGATAHGPGVDSPFHAQRARLEKKDGQADPLGEPLDIEFTRTLIEDGRPDPNPYATPRIELTRHDAEAHLAPAALDLFELYWADVSRPSTAVWSIAADLVQLVVHLTSLGRTTAAVASARAQDGGDPTRSAWDAIYGVQKFSYYLFSTPFVAGHLLLAFLIPVFLTESAVVKLAPLSSLVISSWLVGVVVLALALVVMFRGVDGPQAPARRRAFPIAAPFGLSIAAALGMGAAQYEWLGTAVVSPGRVLQVVLVALLVAGYFAMLRTFEATRPGATAWGVVALVVALAGLVLGARQGSGAAHVLAGLLAAGEALVAAVTVAWVIYFVLVIAALLAGVRAFAAGTDRDRRSVHTVAIASMVSPALFMVVVLAIWAVVIQFLAPLVPAELGQYDGVVFRFYHYCAADLPAAAVASCPNVSNLSVTVDLAKTLLNFAAGRAFLVFFGALGLSGLVLLLAVLPGVAYEFMSGHPAHARAPSVKLGLLLRHGLRQVWFATLLLGVALVGLFAGGFASLGREAPDGVATFSHLMGGLLGGTTIGLGVLTGRIAKAFGRLRTPVTTALDVDNWLRERPRDDTPRFRIFERLERLLHHVRVEKYDALLVIAHSQGSVIAADSLRYLRRERGGHGLPVVLCTLGSPLRQLYAERFPDLYHWVLPEAVNPSAGPSPSALGLVAWVNGFCSGDYVGRALWNDPDAQATYEPASELEARRRVAALGSNAATGADICFGVGAHTHYFDGVDPLVFATLDAVIGKTLAAVAARPRV